MPWGGKHAGTQNIKQVWFAGVHSDVGGGYPEDESGLAKVALKWMIDEATGSQFGLVIDQKKLDRYVLGKSDGGYVEPSGSTDAHESLKGVWWLVQFLPRSTWQVEQEREAIRLPKQRRTIEFGETIHRSVIERMTKRTYAPPNLRCRTAAEARSLYVIE
jgi:hypothetical protein